MRAIVYEQYGPAEVLQVKELPKPVPKEGELLVQVRATIVTPTDCSFRQGAPPIVRLVSGLTGPKKMILGVELAGEVAAVGRDVTHYKQGDQVYGASIHGLGAHAEYVCLREDGVLALKPANMSYGEAAAVCDGALTSLIFLRNRAHIRSGQTVLINGASGSVGSFAVQLAKYYGAEVTGVCSGANMELVASLGADRVIDYTKEDFTTSGQRYDIIFDTVAKRSFSECAGSLTRNGAYLTTVPTLAFMFRMLTTSIGNGKKAVFAASSLSWKHEDLVFLTGLIETGKLKSVIDKHYTMDQIVEAHRYVEQGHKRGNVVIALT